MTYDLLMSSGYLAFARHAGVLAGVEEAGCAIDAVVGTSSGALVGALWAAGHSAAAIEAKLLARPPYRFFRPHLAVWQGALSLEPLVSFLRGELPATFGELRRPFAAGVIDGNGRPRLLTEGPLPEAVAASCAIPYLFQWQSVGGARFQDGGVADRLMVEPWQAWRPGARGIAHVVERSAGKESPVPLDGWPVIRTARSGASFFSLGDVAASVAEAKAASLPVLRGLHPA